MEPLVPGKKYRIILSDCCVDVDIVGTFIKMGDGDEYDENDDFYFDIGRIHTYDQAREFKEIK